MAAILADHDVTVSCATESDYVCPPPLLHFSETPFSEAILETMSGMGYKLPTPIQSISWPVALSGRDLIAVAVTGSGKTIGYLLPALWHLSSLPAEAFSGKPRALLVAPTRELAIQIHAETERYQGGLKSVCCYGGSELDPQIEKLLGGVEIVVATPGRLLYLVAKGLTGLSEVSFWVLDEADRMLDMGFMPQVSGDIAAEYSNPNPNRSNPHR